MTIDLPRQHLRGVPRFAAYDLEAAEKGHAECDKFIQVSSELTGFSEAELEATGMVAFYFEELGKTVGIPVRTAFLATDGDAAQRMASNFHGPLARNLIRMWYLGLWKRLPPEWAQKLTDDQKIAFNEFGRNVDRVISARAYQEGLAWGVIGTNPMGAKQLGFGSWAEPPA